jgi:hypothetical protein
MFGRHHGILLLLVDETGSLSTRGDPRKGRFATKPATKATSPE